MKEFFTSFASKTAKMMGSYWAFLFAFLIVVVWASTGSLFNYSDTWQLVINTGTTIVTFLMVFLIQNTQNRDARAMQLKLDELISAMKEAHDDMIDIEDLSDEQLEAIAQKYKNLKQEHKSDQTREVASSTAKEVAEDTAKEVAEETAKRVA